MRPFNLAEMHKIGLHRHPEWALRSVWLPVVAGDPDGHPQQPALPGLVDALGQGQQAVPELVLISRVIVRRLGNASARAGLTGPGRFKRTASPGVEWNWVVSHTSALEG